MPTTISKLQRTASDQALQLAKLTRTASKQFSAMAPDMWNSDMCYDQASGLFYKTSASSKTTQKRIAAKDDIPVAPSHKRWLREQAAGTKHETLANKARWKHVEDPTYPGAFYYVNTETGEQTRTKPADFGLPTYVLGKGLKSRQSKTGGIRANVLAACT